MRANPSSLAILTLTRGITFLGSLLCWVAAKLMAGFIPPGRVLGTNNFSIYGPLFYNNHKVPQIFVWVGRLMVLVGCFLSEA
jgi:hypothetical protein